MSSTRGFLLTALALAALLLPMSSGRSFAAPLTADAVNKAGFSARKEKGLSPSTLKAQVLLDRARFSPGMIDGTGGENYKKALSAFQQHNDLKQSGKLDAATWDKLSADAGEPVIVEYTLTEADVKGPFVEKIPQKLEEMAELKRLDYTSSLELLSEKFHMDEKLLRALNPGKSFAAAGELILVANVERRGDQGKAAKIEVDKKTKVLRALNKEGDLIGFYPATIGSNEKPAPSGVYEVRAVAENPIYHYNPEYKFKGVKSNKPFSIPAGPNNPVGAVWIDLSLKSYGIHGTPEPSKISKTYSHGCVRLTNWDVKDLAKVVSKGTKVEFVD